MKGSDLTQKQLDAAEQFLMELRSDGNPVKPALDQVISMPWENIIRCVALYGAIRAKAVSDGNSPDEPGYVESATKRSQR